MREFGKDWKSVTEKLAGTKTRTQIAAHTAGFKVKLKKDSAGLEDILEILEKAITAPVKDSKLS